MPNRGAGVIHRWKSRLTVFWRDTGRTLFMVVLLLGSMRPTILEGDRILVDRAAYDIRVPFTRLSLWRHDEPERGDIVVLRSPHDEKLLVKRAVGIPGDLIEMRGARLYVNGEPASYRATGPGTTPGESLRAEETVGDRTHAILLSPARSVAPFRVPGNHYFVMGDNRGNSFDSRYWGPVERGRILGRATRVLLSGDPEHYYSPRWERVLQPLS